MNERTIEIFIYPDGRLDTENAAQYLGLSKKTLAMMRCNGTGPEYVKSGKVLYYKEEEAEKAELSCKINQIYFVLNLFLLVALFLLNQEYYL